MFGMRNKGIISAKICKINVEFLVAHNLTSKPLLQISNIELTLVEAERFGGSLITV